MYTFSELSLRCAFYVLLQLDRSRMRLVPEAVLSENDFIEGIPDLHILLNFILLNIILLDKMLLGFPI